MYQESSTAIVEKLLSSVAPLPPVAPGPGPPAPQEQPLPDDDRPTHRLSTDRGYLTPELAQRCASAGVEVIGTVAENRRGAFTTDVDKRGVKLVTEGAGAVYAAQRKDGSVSICVRGLSHRHVTMFEATAAERPSVFTWRYVAAASPVGNLRVEVQLPAVRQLTVKQGTPDWFILRE